MIKLFLYRSASTARNWMLLGIVLYALFGILDVYYYTSSHVNNALLVRFGIVIPLLILCYVLTFPNSLKNSVTSMMASFVIIAISGINGLIAITTPEDKAYDFWFIGLLLVMFWIHNTGLKSWMIIGLHLFLVLTYNATAVYFQQLHTRSIETLVVNNCMIVTAILLSYISLCIIESLIAQDQKIKKELSYAIELKERILSVISHDVRGPVASIMGLLHLCSEGLITAKELKENAKNLTASIDSLNVLLDIIFVWTMDQKEDFPMEKVNINLREVASSALRVFAPYAERKSVVLNNEVDSTIMVYADSMMLNLILRALVSQSFKLTSNGKITITARQTLFSTSIFVEYTGSEFGPEIGKILSNEINAISCTNTAKGFGLSICKELVEKKHAGSFRLVRRNSGGTIVCCELPNHESSKQNKQKKKNIKEEYPAAIKNAL